LKYKLFKLMAINISDILHNYFTGFQREKHFLFIFIFDFIFCYTICKYNQNTHVNYRLNMRYIYKIYKTNVIIIIIMYSLVLSTNL